MLRVQVKFILCSAELKGELVIMITVFDTSKSRTILLHRTKSLAHVAIDLGHASILSLIGDYSTAMEVAERARVKSIDSGWAKRLEPSQRSLTNDEWFAATSSAIDFVRIARVVCRLSRCT